MKRGGLELGLLEWHMKHFRDLSTETIEKLKHIVKTDLRYRPRLRAHSILLSNKGMSALQIVEVMDLNSDTLYRWWRRFEAEGIMGLFDKEGKGRKKNIHR